MKQMKGHFDNIRDEYAYEGEYQEFCGDEKDYQRFKKTMYAFCMAFGLLVMAGGLTMAGRMSATPSVLIPFVLTVLCAVICVYDVMRICGDGMQLKEKTVKVLLPAGKVMGILIALSAIVSVITSLVVLIRYGTEGQTLPVVLYPLSALIMAVCGGLFSFYIHRNIN